MSENLNPKWKTSAPSEMPEILDVAGAAALLKVSVNSIYYLLERRQIPARRVGKGYRFLKSVLLAWLAGDPPAATPGSTAASTGSPTPAARWEK